MAKRVIGTAIVEVLADTKGFNSALGGMGSQLSRSFGKLTSAIGALGLGRLAREAISFGAEYRVQLDNARAAVVGLTDSTGEAEDLLKRMTTFAIQTPFDLPGVQDATTRMLAYGDSFGVTSDNVLDYIKVLGNAAAATGKGTDSMMNVITVLGKISGQGRVMTRDMNTLTANFPSLHPWEILSDVTGQSVKELRRLSLLPGGLSGVVDATEFIDALVKGMDELPGASANWDGLSKATGKTVKQLKALSDEDQFKLFRQFPDMADAMTRRMFTLGGSFEIFKDSIGVSLAEGLVPFFATIQNVMTDPTIMAALDTLISTFADLAAMVVDSVAPVLPMLINSFQHIVVALMPAAPAIGNLAQMFALAMVSLAPLIASLAEFLTWITTLFLKLDPGLVGAITAALLALWIVGFSPISWVVIAVVALAVLIQQNWDLIVQYTTMMVDAVVAAWNWLFDNVIDPVRDFIMAIVDFFTMLYDVLVGNSIIPDLVNAIVEWFDKLFGWVVDIFTSIWNFLVKTWNLIYTTVSAVVGAIVNFVRDHWKLLIAIISGPLGLIVALVISNWDRIKSFISTTINTIKSTVTTVWNAIKNAIVTPIQSARDLAKSAIQAVLDKVRSAWSGLQSFVSGVWNGIKDAITGPIQGAYDFVADKVNLIKGLVQGAIDKVSNLPGAGIVKGIWGALHADGGVFNTPHVGIVAEAGPEAIIPMRNPMRAMQVMHEAGLDRLAASMGRQRFSGPLVSMPGAVIQDATDADLVAQRTLVAMQAAMVA